MQRCLDSVSYSSTTPGHGESVRDTPLCQWMPDDSGFLGFKLEPFLLHSSLLHMACWAPITHLSPCFYFLTISLLFVPIHAVLVNISCFRRNVFTHIHVYLSAEHQILIILKDEFANAYVLLLYLFRNQINHCCYSHM